MSFRNRLRPRATDRPTDLIAARRETNMAAAQARVQTTVGETDDVIVIEYHVRSEKFHHYHDFRWINIRTAAIFHPSRRSIDEKKHIT